MMRILSDEAENQISNQEEEGYLIALIFWGGETFEEERDFRIIIIYFIMSFLIFTAHS